MKELHRNCDIKLIHSPVCIATLTFIWLEIRQEHGKPIKYIQKIQARKVKKKGLLFTPPWNSEEISCPEPSLMNKKKLKKAFVT